MKYTPVEFAAVEVPHSAPGEADLQAEVGDLPVMVRVGVPVQGEEAPDHEAGDDGEGEEEQERVQLIREYGV